MTKMEQNSQAGEGPLERNVGPLPTVARLYYTGYGSRRYKRASVQSGPGEPLCFVSLANEAVRRAVAAERDRWEDAMKQTWQMIDPLRPSGVPGSYARGEYNGIVAALETLRWNLRPNVAGNRLARQGQSELTGLLGGPARSEKE